MCGTEPSAFQSARAALLYSKLYLIRDLMRSRERNTAGAATAAWVVAAIAAPEGRQALGGQVPLVITALYEIEVERELIDVLRAELDAHFDTAESQLETPEVLLSFVRHPRAYSLRHNSNTAIAGWLETLGCRVRGPSILARWHIDRPTTGDTR